MKSLYGILMKRTLYILMGMFCVACLFMPFSAFSAPITLDQSEQYFPDTVGNQWTYRGEIHQGPLQTVKRTEFSNISTVTGTKKVNGVLVTIFNETNQANLGTYDNFYRRDAAGIVYYGRTPETPLEKQMIPYQVVRFPLTTSSSFQQFHHKELDVGRDMDGDRKHERAEMQAWVNIVGIEPVTVPAGSYPDALKIEMQMDFHIELSRSGRIVKGKDTMTAWLVKGIGLVKYIERQEDPAFSRSKQSVTETIEELVEVDLKKQPVSHGRGKTPT